MKTLAKLPHGTLANFKPEKSREKISVFKAAIKHAKEMQDWDALTKAVHWMVQEQTDFVAWWDANVGVRKSAGGKNVAYNADRRSMLSLVKAEGKTGIQQQQVSRWRNGLKRPDYGKRIEKPTYTKGFGVEGRRADLQTGEMEWFTPSEYVEKARDALGKIDLDPASCAAAQKTVKAKECFTVAEDGLKQDWHGTVWLNPPYAGKLVAAFAEKMIASWEGGTIPAAIMLTNAYTETSWFHALANASSAVCFTRGRIKFISPHGEKCAPTNGQSFFYFGKDAALFTQHFADVGLVMVKAKQK